jgi:hypothetical protein
VKYKTFKTFLSEDLVGGMAQYGLNTLGRAGSGIAKGGMRSLGGSIDFAQGNYGRGISNIAGGAAQMVGSAAGVTPLGMAVNSVDDLFTRKRQEMRKQNELDARRSIMNNKRERAQRAATFEREVAEPMRRQTQTKLDAITPESVRAKMDAERREKEAAIAANPVPVQPRSTGGGPFAQINQRVRGVMMKARLQAAQERGRNAGKMGPINPRTTKQSNPDLVAQSMQGLDADLARATGPEQMGPVPREGDINTDPNYISDLTGVYNRNTMVRKRQLATQGGFNPSMSRDDLRQMSTKDLEREAAKRRVQNRVLAPQANNVLGGDPRDKDGNIVANTIRNRDKEVNSRTLKPGETKIGSNRVGFKGDRVTSNERDLTGRMYRDSKKEYSRVRREDERRTQEKENNSVDGQMSKISSMTPEQRAAEIKKLNDETYSRKNTTPDSFSIDYKPQTDTERKYADMRGDMGLAPRTSNRRLRR